jgi:hypothetical protein
VKTYFQGIETQRVQFAEFGGVQIAHEIKVLKNAALGMVIHVTDVSTPENVPENIFELRGHEWKRQFTDEAR